MKMNAANSGASRTANAALPAKTVVQGRSQQHQARELLPGSPDPLLAAYAGDIAA
jgi:hypothetical protein